MKYVTEALLLIGVTMVSVGLFLINLVVGLLGTGSLFILLALGLAKIKASMFGGSR